MITTSDFKRGVQIEFEGQPYQILDVETKTPSARGAATIVTIKARNVITGQFLQKTWRAGEKFNVPDIERKPIQYLYFDGDGYVFMDMESFDQFTLPAEQLEDQLSYLVENQTLTAMLYNGKVAGVELPQFVELAVVNVAPGARGDTASGQVTTPAELETGLTVQVPLFIKAGDRIRVDTTTGGFKDRA